MSEDVLEDAAKTEPETAAEPAPIEAAPADPAPASAVADPAPADPAPVAAADTPEKKSAKKRPADESAPAPARRAVRWQGWLLMVLSLTALFMLMAFHEQLPRGPLWGIGLTLLATLGFADVMGLLRASSLSEADRATAIDWRATWLGPIDKEPFVLAPVVTIPVALLVAVVGALQPNWSWLPPILILALAILAPAAMRRPSLLVFVVGSGIVLPMLGAYGLWDPWETHYGEVAREMLSRDDWISLWWAHEEWFFSKPIFIFWIEALSMGALGVNFHPDGMLAPVHGLSPHPEWAVRFPHYMLTLGALIAIYTLISRVYGKRAGALAAIVVATLPHFFLLSHQAITDMPFVSTMTMAMCMFGLAVAESGQREVRVYRFGPFAISARTLVLGALFAVAVPQMLYLASRNVTLVTGGFTWHHDSFLFGSGGGNAGNPGNPPPRTVEPFLQGLGAEPLSQALYWFAGLFVILWAYRKEKRAQSLAMLAFYIFCAFAFMAKGLLGFCLPGLVALLFLVAGRRWDFLLEGRLRIALGSLVVLVVGAPWYVAMFIRHGNAFTDRLLIHDHINRLTAGVHGDNASIEYFFEQLGYGMFPWIALAPLAIAAWIRFGTRKRGEAGADPVADAQRDVMMVIGFWGTSAFVLFSAMTTKFHHYIFPAVPAAGILIGIALDPLLGKDPAELGRRVLGTLAAVVAPVLVILGVAGWYGDPRGLTPIDVETPGDWVLAHPWPTSTIGPLILAGFALAGMAWWVLRPTEKQDHTSKEGWLASTALFVAPALLALIGRDLAWSTESHPWGMERLIHLFVYNYQRPWPPHFDYRPILTGFAIVSSVTIALAAIRELRPVMIRAFLGTALALAVWSLDFYLVDLAPHWGQREIIEAYYEARQPGEHLIAWQMNWKGENFYSGNGVFTFVDLDTRPLTDWASHHPGERVFFVLEHSRVGSLRSTLHGAEVTVLTTELVDNKFGVVMAQLPGTPLSPTVPPPDR